MVIQKRIALITGTNKGIGLEIARQLAQVGNAVFVGARDPRRGEAAVQTLASQGLTASLVQIDLADECSTVAAAAAIGDHYGRLDVLVNDAGIVDLLDDSIAGASLAAVRRALEINFVGTLAVIQAMLPLLLESPRSASGEFIEHPCFADAQWRPEVSELFSAAHWPQRLVRRR